MKIKFLLLVSNKRIVKTLQNLKFPISLFGLYWFLYILYFNIPDDTLKQIYHDYVVNLCALAINSISPIEQVTAALNSLISKRAHLEVVRGCDGIGVLLLLSSAIIAFSTAVKHKLWGLFIGLILVYLTNLIRIVGLYFIVAYQKQWFLPLHSYIAPTLILLLCSLFFIWWAYAAPCSTSSHDDQ